jgi:hypothetical protein
MISLLFLCFVIYYWVKIIYWIFRKEEKIDLNIFPKNSIKEKVYYFIKTLPFLKNQSIRLRKFLLAFFIYMIFLNGFTVKIIKPLIVNSEFSQNEILDDRLKNNLENLNGEWSWKNSKEGEFWWIRICFNNETQTGTYQILQQYDNWGDDKNNKVESIDEGSFQLKEGYDIFGDKAYVGANTLNGNTAFLITQLDNNLAVDWLLRIRLVEKEQFGERMHKVSNKCK